MKHKHFLYFIVTNLKTHSNTKAYIAIGSLLLFREQIGKLLQKNYEIEIKEI
jgi:hypothetical protein